MPLTPVPTLTQLVFLTEDEVFAIVKVYLPDNDLTSNNLYEWISKDGAWGPTKRKQFNKQRKSGCWYNLILEEFRDFAWNNISNIHLFRTNIKSTMSSICTKNFPFFYETAIRSMRDAIICVGAKRVLSKITPNRFDCSRSH